MPGDVFQHYLEDEAGDGVEVAGEGLAAEAQCFERDGSATREGVDHQRGVSSGMRRANECAPGVQVLLFRGVVPIGEVGDEIQ